MKAVVFNGPNKALTVEERQKPVAAAGELVLKVLACGICGSDLHGVKTGFYPTGIVMGHEFCGLVDQIGEGVEDWQIGDKALALPAWHCETCQYCLEGKIELCKDLKSIGIDMPHDGAFAEYIRVKAALSIKVPETLQQDTLTVLYEPLSTGLGSFRHGNVGIDDHVLIIGGGAIGLSVALWARKFGVNLIGLSEMQPERLQRASACGANVVIDASQEQDPVAAFIKMTGKEPTVIFECVGLPGMFKRIVDMAPLNTRVIVTGTCMEEESFTVVDAALKRLECVFHFGYGQADVEHTLTCMAVGSIDPSPLLTNKTTLDELPETFADLMKPNAECKVVVCP